VPQHFYGAAGEASLVFCAAEAFFRRRKQDLAVFKEGEVGITIFMQGEKVHNNLFIPAATIVAAGF
jgi:hypothetical protein